MFHGWGGKRILNNAGKIIGFFNVTREHLTYDCSWIRKLSLIGSNISIDKKKQEFYQQQQIKYKWICTF